MGAGRLCHDLRILKRPIYAGAYAYGRYQSQRLPGSQRKVLHKRQPMEQWIVLKPDHHEGYIAWDEYLHNQEQLAHNRQLAPMAAAGPAREGTALLRPGLLRPLWPAAASPLPRQAIYVCEAHAKTLAQPRCQRFGVAHVDATVAELLLAAVQPAQIELALAATQTAEAERQQLHRHWQERLERARYEATLARRRYEQVDPDNRLVAAELEQRWEARLQEVQTVEAEALKLHTKAPLPLSAQEETAIRRLAEDLPALWLAPTTTPADRKRLLRCLIQSVTLDSFTQVGFTRLLVLWHTGATSEVTVPRPRPGCRTPEASRHRIAELAQTMTDDQIAAQLNAEGLPTAWRGPWTPARCASCARSGASPAPSPTRPAKSSRATRASARPRRPPHNSTSRPAWSASGSAAAGWSATRSTSAPASGCALPQTTATATAARRR